MWISYVRRRAIACMLLMVGMALGAAEAHGQLNSNAQNITLNATLAETLTIAATPTTVNFTLVQGGIATGSAPVAITTSWLLLSTRATVKLYSYFATPSAALSDASTPVNSIPSSEVLGMMTTGTPTSFTAYSQSNTLGPASGGLLLFSQAISATNRFGTRSDNLALEINLASQAQLPAGSYTGTLVLMAQAP